MGLFSSIFKKQDKKESRSCDLYRKTCPEMISYKIRGRAADTNRIRTEIAVRLKPFEPEDFKKEGTFTEIKTVELIQPEPPSIRQVGYAENLGIQLPDHCCKEDVSCLISRFAGETDRDNMIDVRPTLANYAARKGVFLSVYSGEMRALNLLWYSLSDEEKIIFFIFCIHQNLIGNKEYDVINSTYYPAYKEFANEVSNNIEFLRSIARYVGSDLSLNQKPNEKRNAYAIAREFLVKRKL